MKKTPDKRQLRRTKEHETRKTQWIVTLTEQRKLRMIKLQIVRCNTLSENCLSAVKT